MSEVINKSINGLIKKPLILKTYKLIEEIINKQVNKLIKKNSR